MRQQHRKNQGFTLIELSIVLVIIGLIIGGVMVGQDLIGAAYTRAQITQIEKYNSAVNTFRTKYAELPGDLDAASATQFGFVARASVRGRGDNNGLIEGYNYPSAVFSPTVQGGEPFFFWTDLSTVGFLDSKINAATDATIGYNITPVSTPPLSSYLPLAKIGQNNYVYVYSGGACSGGGSNWNCNGVNYFGLSIPSIIQTGNNTMTSTPGLTVSQAYNIDTKIDDGLPTSGKVTANYVYGWSGANDGVVWAAGGGATGTAPGTAASGSSTTCYDNGDTASATMQYSMEISNGSNVSCALSFVMQGAAR